MQNNSQPFIACALVSISTLLYGFVGFLGSKLLSEGDLSIASMLFWRFFISSLCLCFLLLKNGSVNRILSLDRKILVFTLISGAMGYAGSSWLFFLASQYTGTGVAAMIVFFSYPIMIAFFSWFTLKNTFNVWTFAFLLIMVFGIYLLKNVSHDSIGFLGTLIALLSALSYSYYIIGSKKFSNGSDTDILAILVSVGCTLFFLISACVTHTFSFPSVAQQWVLLIIIGIINTAIPLQLLLMGLKYISSTKASILSGLDPLVAVILGVAFLEESISSLQIIGAGMIILSSIFIQFQKEE